MQLKFNHQRMLQGLQQVTLLQPDSPSTIVCERAAKYPLTVEEVGRSTGIYLGSGNGWTIGEDEVGDNDIQPGWNLVDSKSARHRILKAGHSDIASFWELTTINLKIVFNLRDIIEIWKPRAGKVNAEGRRVKRYDLLANRIPCRLQPEDRERVTDLGIPQLDKGYKCICETLPVVELDYQVRVISMLQDGRQDLTGSILEIEGVSNTDSLSDLPSLKLNNQGAQMVGLDGAFANPSSYDERVGVEIILPS